MGKKRSINLIIGPLLFVLFSVLLPSSVFSTFAARSAIGTVAWMAYWWVTGPIDYAVTAFLPIALNALFQMTDMSSVIANYGSVHSCRSCWMIWRFPSVITTLWMGFFSLFAIETC